MAITWSPQASRRALDEESLMTATALYHPYIRPRDDAWLKAAALSWPRMVRLMPHAYQGRDKGGVKVLTEARVLRPQDPSAAAAEIALPFASFIDERKDELRASYGLEHVNSWAADLDDEPAHRGDPRLAYVHVEKTAWPVINALETAGLAQVGRGKDFQWLGMHPTIARTYMAALAQQVADSYQLTPITDQSAAAVGSAGDLEWLASTLLAVSGHGQLQNGLAIMAVQRAIPERLEGMRWSEVMELREALKVEMRRFRANLETYEAELATFADIADAERAREHIEDLRSKAVDDPLEDLEERLRELRVPFRRSWELLLASGGGLVGPQVIESMGGPHTGALGGTVLFAAGIAYGVGNTRRVARAEIRDSPVGYLYRLKHGSDPLGSIGRLVPNLRAGWL
jgi:hypothetical protein